MTETEVELEKLKTRDHIDRVRHFLRRFAFALLERAEVHDKSKLEEPEASAFAKANSQDFLAKSTYGSEEYKKSLREVLGPALEHHYASNSHHPEHYENGIEGMDLLDLVEMFCDWKAATERHNDGNIFKSIDINETRFNMSSQLAEVLRNTANQLDQESW